MQYPVRNVEQWEEFRSLSTIDQLEIEWRDFRYRRRVRAVSRDVGLRQLTPARPDLSGSDIATVVCVKNGAFYVDFFLRHYRKLGVTRFIVLDDASVDDTREILARQPDVDLFESESDYTGSARGLRWRDALIDLYGRDRWYLSVDIDEFLIFPGCEERSVSDFAEDLERSSLTRAMAPMIDLYPDGSLSTGTTDNAVDPTDVSPMMDGDGYLVANRKFCTSVSGGPRQRLYGNEIRLTKFPMIFFDEHTRYHGGSIHGPFPFRRNFNAPAAILLHFKFSANSMTEFAEIVDRGDHFDGARFYRMITSSRKFGADADLRYSKSVRVEDSESLVSQGFMEDLRV